MDKNGFGINNLEWLMCHKTKPKHVARKVNFMYDIHPYGSKNLEKKS